MPNKPAQANDPFKKIKTGQWSKYGGARRGLIHSQSAPSWACQCCGKKQPRELPGFFINHESSGDKVKLCAKCFYLARRLEYSFEKTKVVIIRQYRD